MLATRFKCTKVRKVVSIHMSRDEQCWQDSEQIYAREIKTQAQNTNCTWVLSAPVLSANK